MTALEHYGLCPRLLPLTQPTQLPPVRLPLFVHCAQSLEELPQYAALEGRDLNKLASGLKDVFSAIKNKLPTTHGVRCAAHRLPASFS